ncbi:MAG TPA: L-threonylcarbamoyladenylate synthase [Patescibacteria group bacterium]|nr:L-threonylcarbamoyladenylate synthase [Patescibacteria group bacterium]
MQNEINQAVKVLNQGGIVIFPTDTAFGIGCKVSDEAAVKRLFTIRKRPLEKAVPVLVSSIEMAEKYVDVISDDVREKLIKPYWPGALTIVLPLKKGSLPNVVVGEGDSVGLRMSNQPIALEIIGGVGEGITGPSANFSGKPTPYSFEEMDKELLKLVDYVVPGEIKLKQASTVIDCTIEPWRILRQGAVEITLSS